MSVESVEGGDVGQSEVLDFSELPQKTQDVKAQLGRTNHVAHYYGSSIEPSTQVNTVNLELAKTKELLREGIKLLGVNQSSTKSFAVTALLCLFGGIFGLHRFYAGKPLTGLLMLCTLGGLGIWKLIDLVMIVTGSFEDSEGKIIKLN